MIYSNILRQYPSLLITIFICVCSCKKSVAPPPPPPPPNPTVENNPPGAFTVLLEAYNWDTAKIVWTEAIDPDRDSVLYKVYINDTLKAESVETREYTFKDLRELTSYDVKVIALDNKAKQSSSTVSFQTKKYWLQFLRRIDYGNVSSYSLQKTGQMVKANDGGYVLVGDSQIGDWPYGEINMFTMKIDSLGNKIWQKRYPYNSGNSDLIKLINYDNGYLLLGDENLIRVDNNGDILWRQTTSLTLEIMEGVSAGSDGSIYTVGYAQDTTRAGYVWATLGKYDPDGNILWKKTFSRTTREELKIIKVFSDNEIMALGGTNEPTADFWLLKLNSEGDIAWEKTYNDPGYAFPRDLIKTKEGNYVFTGFSVYWADNFYLQMVNANGDNMWTYLVSDDYARGYGIAETNDNELVVTGTYILSGSSQSTLYKFDKNGKKRWQSLYGEMGAFLVNKSVFATTDGGYFTNAQEVKGYHPAGETDQIYLYKTNDKGEFF
jgi:hypothetical protein